MHKHRLWFTLRIKKGVLSRTNVRAELPLPLANIMMDGCDDHDLFLRKIRFQLFKKFLRHTFFLCFLLTIPRQWSRMVLQKRIAKEEF